MKILIAIIIGALLIRGSLNTKSGKVLKVINPTPKYKKPSHPALNYKLNKNTIKPPGAKKGRL